MNNQCFRKTKHICSLMSKSAPAESACITGKEAYFFCWCISETSDVLLICTVWYRTLHLCEDHIDVYIMTHKKIVLRFVQWLLWKASHLADIKRDGCCREGLKLTAVLAFFVFFFWHFLWTKISVTVTNAFIDCSIANRWTTHITATLNYSNQQHSWADQLKPVFMHCLSSAQKRPVSFQDCCRLHAHSGGN